MRPLNRLIIAFLSTLALAASACGSTEKPVDPATLTQGGAGIILRIEGASGLVVVDHIAVKGAAAQTDIKHFEYVYAVDGTSLQGLAMDDVVARIRGPIGSKVTLRVGNSEADARDVVITRAELPEATLECAAGDCVNGTGSSVDMWGARYDGEFKDGWYHGKGKLVEPTGRTYEGDFVQGAATGTGIMTQVGGRRWEGAFDNGYPTGTVKAYVPNGDVYDGESKEYTMHGQGKLTRPSNGDVWDGRYEYDNLIDGLWQHYPEGGDGRSCVRYIRDGKLNEHGTINYAPKDKKKKVSFQGPFGDDCVANGEGIMTYEKKKMQGNFVNDEAQKGAKVIK